MAGDGGVVEIVFRAKLDQLDKDMAATRAKAAKAGDAIGADLEKRVGSKLGGIRQAAAGVGSAFAGIQLSSAFTSRLSEAGDVARRFQDQVSGAASATGLAMDTIAAKAKSFEFIPPTVAAQGIKDLSLLNQSMGIVGQASLDLSSKTLEVAQAMSVVAGVPVEEVLNGVAGAARGEYDSIQKLVPALNGAAVEQRALADSGKTMAKELTEAEKSQAALNLILDEGNRFLPQLAANSDNAAAAQRRKAAAAEEAKIAMGDKLLPIMEKVSDVTSKLFGWFSKLPGPVQNVALGAIVLGGVLAPLAFGISGLAGAFSALGLGSLFAAGGVWAVLWPILAVIAVLALIAGAVYLVVKHWDTIKAATGAAWDWVYDKVSSVVGAIKSAVLTGVMFIVDKFLMMAEWTTKAAAKAFGWVPGVGDKLESAARAVEEFRNNVNDKLAGIRDKDIRITTTYTDVFVTVGNRTYGGTSTSGIGQYAAGGLFTRPTLGIFGEAGPELLLPLTDMGRTRDLLLRSGLLEEPDVASLGSYGGGRHDGGPVGITIINNIQGSLVSERDLVATARGGIANVGHHNNGTGL